MPFKDKNSAAAKESRRRKSARYKQRNPDKERDFYYKKNYGITLDQYNTMFNSQKGCCAICGIHQIDLVKRLAVDHDHATGQIRELLCFDCNTGLGKFKDSLKMLDRARDYLIKYGQ